MKMKFEQPDVKDKSEIRESVHEGWATNHALAQTLKEKTAERIKQIAEQYRSEHPGWFREFPDARGFPRIHYSPQLIELISAAILNQRETLKEAPKDWLTASAIADKVDGEPSTIQTIAKDYCKIHPEWQDTFLDIIGHPRTHYSPELIKFLEDELNTRKKLLSEGWRNRKKFVEELGINYEILDRFMDFYQKGHPEWFFESTIRPKVLLSPRFMQELKEHPYIKSKEMLSGGWRSTGELVEELQKDFSTVKKFAKICSAGHPDWVKERPGRKRGEKRYIYSPELVQKIKEKVISNAKPPPPRNWITAVPLGEAIKKSPGTAKTLANKLIREHPEWIGEFQNEARGTSKYYAPELVRELKSLTKEVVKPKDNWLTIHQISIKLETNEYTIKKLINLYLKDHPKWSSRFLDAGGHPRIHYSPELVQRVVETLGLTEKAAIESKKKKRIKRKPGETLEKTRQLREMVTSLEVFKHSFELGEINIADIHRHIRSLGIDLSWTTAKNIINRLGWKKNSQEDKQYRVIAEDLKTFGRYFNWDPFALAEIAHALHPKIFRTSREAYEQIKVNVGKYRQQATGIINEIPQSVIVNPKVEGLIRANERDKWFREFLKKPKEEVFAEMDSQIAGAPSEDHRKISEESKAYWQDVFAIERPLKFKESLREGREFPSLHQKVALKEIRDKKRILIADEMGTGKTAIALMGKEMVRAKKALIVTPYGIKTLWQERIQEYYREGEAPQVAIIDPETKFQDLEKAKEADYVVINYQLLLSRNGPEAKRLYESLSEMGFDYLIVDEAHNAKRVNLGDDAKSTFARAVWEITRRSPEIQSGYTVLLSGTPFPNRPKDAAVTLSLLEPQNYPKPVDALPLIQRSLTSDTPQLIHNVLRERMLRRSKEDVLELQPLTIHNERYELSTEERKEYEAIRDREEKPDGTEFTFTDKFEMLERFLINPQILGYRGLESSKFKKLKEVLSGRLLEEPNGKIVIYSSRYAEGITRSKKGEPTVADFLKAEFGHDEVLTLDGETQQKGEVLRNFQSGTGSRILFANLEVGGEGIDLTRASTVIFLDHPWTISELQQGISRLHREGQQKPVRAIVLEASDTIETDVRLLAGQKEEIIEMIIRGIQITEGQLRLLEQSLLSDKQNETEVSLGIKAPGQVITSMFNHIHSRGADYARHYLFSNRYRAGTSEEKSYAELLATVYQQAQEKTKLFIGENARLISTLITELENRGLINTKKVFDLGAGTMALEQQLSGNVKPGQVVAFDLNPFMLSRGLAALREKGKSTEKIKAISGNAAELPIKEDSMDLVVSSLVLHLLSLQKHDYYDEKNKRKFKIIKEAGDMERIKALLEINRVLRFGGTGIISFNQGSIQNSEFRKLVETLPQFGFKVIEEFTGTWRSKSNQQGTLTILFEKIRTPDISQMDWRDLRMTPGKLKGKPPEEALQGEFTLNGRNVGEILQGNTN